MTIFGLCAGKKKKHHSEDRLKQGSSVYQTQIQAPWQQRSAGNHFNQHSSNGTQLLQVLHRQFHWLMAQVREVYR